MIHLTLEQILELHDLLIRETGGSHGVRDMGAVESAVAQPQMGFGGKNLYPTLVEKAAALGFSLINNHAFVDGNKRIGLSATVALLRANGADLKTTHDDLEAVVLAVASGEMARDDWTQWLREHLVKIA